jgi:hypothetical protein
VAIPSDSECFFVASLCSARFWSGRPAQCLLVGDLVRANVSLATCWGKIALFSDRIDFELRNRLEAGKDLWNELDLLNYPPFYRIRSS